MNRFFPYFFVNNSNEAIKRMVWYNIDISIIQIIFYVILLTIIFYVLSLLRMKRFKK